MRLVTSVSFAVLFNGECLETFYPSRGIRQGDPISPYLFLLCAEGLSCLLNSKEESNRGISIAMNAPKVSHLLFADDILLFLKANVDEADVVNRMITTYCDASGQQVNLSKSSIFFSKGCGQTLKDGIKALMHVENESLTERYLGLPTGVGNSKNGVFKYLKDRVWKRIQGWMEQSLSAGGKEVLIKAVAQAIPTYSMGCFKLPRGLCQHINLLIRKFWWGGTTNGRRKTNWVAWEKLIQPKFMGGLGFRDIELFDLALLARQAWRILQNPMAMTAQLSKVVYYPACDFLQAPLGSRPSQV